MEIHAEAAAPAGRSRAKAGLQRSVPASAEALCWHPVNRLGELALTGLARKVLKRIDLYGIMGTQTPLAPPVKS